MTKQLVTIVFCVLAASALEAAVPLELRNSVALPSVGLKLPLPTDAQSQPIPPAEARTYVLQRGNERWTEDRYRALELWYAQEHVAEWALPSRGTRLIVGRVSLAPPVGFVDTDVTREQFAQYTNSPMAQVEQKDARSLHTWLATFSGCESLGSAQALPVGRTRLSHLLRYPTGRRDIAAWLLHFDRGGGGLSHLPDVWMALVLVVENAPNPAAEVEFVEKGMLPNLSPMGRFEGRETPLDRARRERTQQGVRPHPTRDAAHASIAAHADWWAMDSDDFVLLCNASVSRDFAKHLLTDLQQARSLYTALLPGTAETAQDVAVIRLFATEAEYDAYVDAAYAWTAGLYDGNRRELILRPVAAKTNGAAYRRMIQTALHEGFHQYLHQAFGSTATPSVWYNEGYAAFFEELTFRNGRPQYDESRDRLSTLEVFLKVKPPQPIPIRELLSMSYESFYAGSDHERLFKYSLAWAFLYFLERGAPLVRNRPYDDILPTYLESLQRTGDGALATQAAFEKIDLNALERDFRDFWTTPRSRSLAKRR